MTRSEIITFLRERDGDRCMFPGCDRPLDDPRDINTVDHKYPKSLAKADGWTREQVDSLSNMQVMHRSCNILKSDRLPDEDGKFKVVRKVRSVKVTKPAVCGTCQSGRLLFPGETCSDCGSGPQPSIPKVFQRIPRECDHEKFLCWACGPLGIIERRSKLDTHRAG